MNSAFRFAAVFLVLGSTACRASTKETPSPPDASAPVTVIAAPSAPPAAADAPRDPAPEEPLRAGVDAGPVKPRRLAKIDGGAAPVVPEALVAAGATEPAVDSAVKRKKPNAGSMSDEAPYGGDPAGSGAAVLKKTPLPSEDPWAKAPTSR